MVCPVCQNEYNPPADWCSACGAHLRFLRQHPKRVAYCVGASIALGLGLFLALGWQVFTPLLRGWPAAGPGPWFWWGFALGTFFLGFGLAARQQLTGVLRRLLQSRGR